MSLRHTTHLVATVLVALLLYSCASIGSPEGGPRDYTPPVMVKASPTPGALRVDKGHIVLYFNEIVQIKDQQKKVVISPTQHEAPLIKTLGKRITIDLRDSLQPNTTYCIDFADAIVDNNEGNALEGFSYAFSTGDSIDTLQVSGIVLRARDLEPMQHVIVGLHTNLDDSAFTRLPFDRLSRTNDRGQFTLRNLKPGRYHVFALTDMDGDYRMARSEDIAFLDEIIVPSVGTYESMDTVFTWDHKVDTVMPGVHPLYLPNDLLLCMFNENYRSHYLKTTKRIDRNRLHVLLSAPSDSLPRLEVLSPRPTRDDWCVLQYTPKRDSVFYWLTDSALTRADTITTALHYMHTDSLDRLVPTTDTIKFAVVKTAAQIKAERQVTKKKKKHDSEEEETDSIVPHITLAAVQKGTLEIGDTIAIQCETPLSSIDQRGVHLEMKRDSLWIPMTDVSPLQLAHDYDPMRYVVMAPLKPDSTYRLTIDSAAVRSLYDLPSMPFKMEVKVRGVEEYANVFFSVNVRDSAFAQLVDGSQRVIQTCAVKGGKFEFHNVLPGTYFVLLVLDKNGNGQWDTGNYSQHLQPEEVYYYPKKLRLRRNWDVEQTWNIYETAIDMQKPLDIKRNRPASENRQKKQGNDEEEEDEYDDEFNSQGFGDNIYSGNRYRDYQNNRRRR